jgi:hypothetical protein
MMHRDVGGGTKKANKAAAQKQTAQFEKKHGKVVLFKTYLI